MHIEFQKKCTGCGACKSVCPTNAIDMKMSEEGFLVPIISAENCVNCEKCIKVCPIGKSYDNEVEPELFAFSAEEKILTESSSGGIFTILAEKCIKDGGVVFGAAFNDLFEVTHIGINRKEDLERLRFSKYVQSDTLNTYKEALKLLQEGKTVLYSGTPCQIAGLYGVLDKEYEKLFTVELICHGVPAPGIFKSYLENEYGIENIKNVEMRKRDGWGSCFNIKFKDGKLLEGSPSFDVFQSSFLKNVFLRNSCYECQFAKLPRVADLTIGDFWWAKRHKIGDAFEKKSSLVIVNNDKGCKFYEKALMEANYSYSHVNLKNLGLNAKKLNRNIYEPLVHETEKRDRFFSIYNGKNLKEAAYKALYPNSVGLLVYMMDNYGSCATNYALYKAVENLGYTPIIANNLVATQGISTTFAKENLRLTGDFLRRGDWKSLNTFCDSFIVGSDQSMRWDFGRVMGNLEWLLMAFAEESKRKIAYAVSYGPNRNPGDEFIKRVYKKLFSRFTAFSVREDYAVEMSKKYFDREAEWVIDPVFLIDKNDYLEIIKKSKIKFTEPYLLAYLRYYSDDKLKFIEDQARLRKVKAVIICDATNYETLKKKYNSENIVEKPEFIDWLAYYANASYIVTDSFHGTCFSIIMEKKYVSLKAGTVQRFDSLANTFGFSDSTKMSIYDDVKNVPKGEDAFNSLNYKILFEIIGREKERGLKWLEEALKKPMEKSDTDNQTLIDYVSLLKEYNQLKNQR